jgi:hypothetical protein
MVLPEDCRDALRNTPNSMIDKSLNNKKNLLPGASRLLIGGLNR